jgi:biopolymer transport protein TolR
MASKKNKDLDFTIDLIPVISLMSVCICFLLLTAVWVRIGSVNVKQAVGGQPAAETAKKPTVWVNINGNGDTTFDVRDARIPARLAKLSVKGVEGKPDHAKIKTLIQDLRATEPNLATALIQPEAQAVYENIIDLMDLFKAQGVIDLGVSPL